MRTLLAPALLVCLIVPASALADTSGGVSPGSPSPSGGILAGSVGVPPPATPRPRHRARPRRHRSPGLSVAYLSVSPGSSYLYGRPARVSFEVKGRVRTVRLSLVIERAGGRGVVRRIDLGRRRTGVRQRYSLSGLEGGALPEGGFLLHLWGRGLRGARKAGATGPLSFHWHRFPLVGQFSYGDDPSGRFGAPRNGHTHQGQDIAAPEGTPVVAPRGGLVKVVAYQQAGAGNYVVLHGEGEDLDYVFMHLHDGSIAVKQGEWVATGQLIGQVGTTGDATAPHLHFEMWRGPWGAGGHPIDPLPFLRRWDTWS